MDPGRPGSFPEALAYTTKQRAAITQEDGLLAFVPRHVRAFRGVLDIGWLAVRVHKTPPGERAR